MLSCLEEHHDRLHLNIRRGVADHHHGFTILHQSISILSSMSPPTSALERLSLGNMPNTRTQSQRSDDDDDNSEAFETAGVSAPSNLNYDLGELSPTTTQRVRSAWRGHFVVEQLKQFHSGEPDEYYAIQITEPRSIQYSVRIGSPSSRFGEIECSSNCKSPKPCQHIFWLLDQIAKRSMPESQRGGTLKFSRQGSLVNAPDVFTQIKHMGAKALTESLNWRLSVEDSDEGDEGEEDDVEEPVAATVPPSTKLWMVRDILATLSTKTPEEYRPDLFNDSPSSSTTHALIVKRDLERTMARVLLQDDYIFNYFRRLLSIDHCAGDFFEKMAQKAMATMAQMDACKPPRKNEAPSGQIHDVEWCASTLQAIVNSIEAYAVSRNFTLGKGAREKAAKTLVSILENVVERHQDLYAGNDWRNTPQRATPIDTHNLFQVMVGHSGHGGNKLFIVDQLSDLGDAAHSVVDTLDLILSSVRSNNGPRIYVSRLESLIRRLKSEVRVAPTRRGPGEPSSSKRSGASSGTGSVPPSKRMK